METASATRPPTILPSRQASASVRRIPSSYLAPSTRPAPISSPSRGQLPCGPTDHRWTRRRITLRRSAKYGQPTNHWPANERRLELTTNRVVDGYRTVHPTSIGEGSEGKPCGAEFIARRGNGVFKTQGVMIVDADEEGYAFGEVVNTTTTSTAECHEQQQGVTDLAISGVEGNPSSAGKLVGSAIRRRTAKGVGRRERGASGELKVTDEKSFHRKLEISTAPAKVKSRELAYSQAHRSADSVYSRSMDPSDECLRSEFFAGLERAAKLSRRVRKRRRMQQTEGGTEEGNSTKLDVEDKENRIYEDRPYSREFIRTSTAISLLPSKVGSLTNETDVISDASICHQTSSSDVITSDVPEVILTSPLDAGRPRFLKYKSSAKSSRKRTIAESAIKGCATQHKLRRTQASLNLQNCDRRSADRLNFADARSHLSLTPFVTGDDPDTVVQSIHQMAQDSRNSGTIELLIYIHRRFLTVHVVQAKFRHLVDSYVQVSLIPDAVCDLPVQTETVRNDDQPKYNKKFSFELSPEDTSKWLIVSARQRSTDNRIIGSASFRVSAILRNRSVLNGWYYLHPESTSEPNNSEMQLAVSQSFSTVVSIAKSKAGYGFAIVGVRPVTVSRVHPRGPADRAGLREGDVIWRINRLNVWNSTAESIARIVRLSFDGRVVLEVLRQKQTSRDGMLGRLHYTGNQYWDESSFDSDSTTDGTLNQTPCDLLNHAHS